MAQNALISVIVPVYKVEKYLDRCVESIVGQTYKNLEIILVDDGSPDRCGAMCDVWAQRDSRIRVIHKENGGLSDARNAGLEIATGAYIGFVDSDDWIFSRMYETLLHALQDNRSDIAECRRIDVPEGIQLKETLSCEVSAVRYGTEQAEEQLILEAAFQVTVWNKLYRRETIGDIRFEKGRQHEDVFFTHQVFGNCNAAVITDYAGYVYLQRAGSIMGEGMTLRSLDAIEAKARQVVYMRKHFPALVPLAERSLFFMGLYLGQKALRTGDNALIDETFLALEGKLAHVTLRLKDLGPKQMLWYRMAKANFRGCCKLRNRLGVGL